MRVLHVSAGNLFGGLESCLATLAATESEMEQHFAFGFEGEARRRVAETGRPTAVLGPVRLANPSSVRRARQRAEAYLAEERIDVMVCHAAWTQAAFGAAAARVGVPLILWLHSPLDRWDRCMVRRSRPRAVIANSRHTASLVAPRLKGLPIEVIYCPVSAHAEQPAGTREAVRGEHGTASDTVVILQACRFEPWKGHETNLRAFARIEAPQSTELWFAGGAQKGAEGDYVERLRALAAELGIAGRVKFLGHRNDVPRLMAAADILCQPNTGAEPFGITFVEALGAGLPCVTTALGGPLEIVDESCGFLVPPGDAGELASVLGRLVRDPELRARLGSAGPARAGELCDPVQQVGRLSEFLAQYEAARQ